MATAQENWQTNCTSISQRTKYIFNTALLSDVKFIFSVSNGERESKVIPAHKLVLSIGSPVFFAMFYGQMADTRDSIELLDCDYESLLELFRFIYSDEVELNGSNVMRVLYLAKKYLVPSLAAKCAEFLRKNLDASNVFSILPHAQKFDDKDLANRCWEVIEVHTEEALTSDDFVATERSLVESVVKRQKLNVKEVELFKAVDRWAEKKIEEQGIVTDGNAKRRIIGEEILKEIRFPLMLQKEFASFVIDSNILNMQEVGVMIKHYNQVLTSPLPYLQSPRILVLKRACRFKNFKQHPAEGESGWWNYSRGEPDNLVLNLTKDVHLHGVQHFGREGCEYTVSMEIKDATTNLSMVKKSGTYSSEKDLDHIYYGFDVLFDTPVILESRKRYEISSKIIGLSSWYGEKGETIVNFEGLNFTFRKPDSPGNGTSNASGQFPVFLFTHNG
ncbi:PREDICTED: BTB/POZ domain-containing protein 6-like isoform X1 [Acropora digitifera]|uniref:BTB/POZ domain-containing protein 6-like isoform X1 n=1 Tax=Acropora digitifera TaxID=70779 RepID=UPI00077A5C2E|nr:PREDICTED: BTB/POZ domain-containing protein 6-like isoform X1 [Acropora digitifera]